MIKNYDNDKFIKILEISHYIICHYHNCNITKQYFIYDQMPTTIINTSNPKIITIKH